ncbi:MAG TPA: acyltransferase [bacterium]|jgi:peptidoglycan/LPS O-acetylase OafA/YrhL|nr:acyltransferase [bacterium]
MKKRYLTLDGMRGVAAIAIIVVHGGTFFGAFNFPEGSLAVDFFFALSGFVVSEAYSGRLAQTMTWAEFMRLRLIRFYPLYLLGTLLGLIPWIGNFFMGNPLHISITGMVASLLLGLIMLPSPFSLNISPEFYPLMLVAWTLFWELIANAFYGAFWRRLNRRLLLALAGVGAMGLYIAQRRTGSMIAGDSWSLNDVWIAASRVCFSFCAGLLLQRLPRSGLKIYPPLLLAGLLLFLGLEPSKAFRCTYELLFVLILSPTLIYLGAAADSAPGRESRIYAFLGATSYAVYVLHLTCEFFVHMLFKHLNVPVESWAPWSGIGFIAGLLVLCAYLDTYFDRPARLWLKHFWGDRSGKLLTQT